MVVDRIEGDYAVVEKEGNMVDIPLYMLPEEVTEGDILRLLDGEYIIDNETAVERKEELFARLGNLFNKE